MTHAIIELQTTLVAALLADTQLVAALGSDAIFDAPPMGTKAPFVAIIRHDVLVRDGDETPGFEHLILLHCRHNDASRKAVLDIADRVVITALSANLSSVNLIVTHVQHRRTDTGIDNRTGQARAAIALRILTEPVV